MLHAFSRPLQGSRLVLLIARQASSWRTRNSFPCRPVSLPPFIDLIPSPRPNFHLHFKSHRQQANHRQISGGQADTTITTMASFLHGLCDLPEDTEVSWRSFLHLEDVCSLTTLGAVASAALALLVLLTVLLQYCVCRGRHSRGRRARKRAAVEDAAVNNNGGKLAQSSLNDHAAAAGSSGGGHDSGHEESKGGGGHDSSTDNEDFMSSATEPLLASSAAGTSTSYRTDEEDTDDVDAEEEGGRGGGRNGGRARGPGRERAKKGTGVHWVKLLLYWVQAGYHLCMGGFFLVDGRADDPYKCECRHRKRVLSGVWSLPQQ